LKDKNKTGLYLKFYFVPRSKLSTSWF